MVNNKASELGKISRCALLSIVVTVMLCGIFAVAVYLWQIDEGIAQIAVFAIMIVSVLFGAYVLAKNITHSGLINGLIMSIMYFLALYAVSFILSGRISFAAGDLARFITVAASGMLGGILGVNS